MENSLVHSTINYLTNLMPPELMIFLMSVAPILELRGGMIAASILGIDWRYAFIICIIGTLLPVPFIILFIERIFELLKKTKLRKMIYWLEAKANKKGNSISKYRNLGLFILVAIPLPGAGAWTGALVATLLCMKLKEAMPPIVLGVITSAVIMAIISYAIPTLFV